VWSPFYIQARSIPSHPEVLHFVGDALAQVIQNEVGECEHLVGLATAGIPLATAAALKLGAPMCYTRKIPGIRSLDDILSWKDYGEHSLVEGELTDGARLVLIDDVSESPIGKSRRRSEIGTCMTCPYPPL
jgi:orotate phosphoribosyltransferase